MSMIRSALTRRSPLPSPVPTTTRSPRSPEAARESNRVLPPPATFGATMFSSMLNLSLMILANQPFWVPW